MQLGFLQHSLMISRMHFLIELACRKSPGQAELVSWVQAFGIHPIRDVLIETTHEARARKMMHLVHHPLVCGPVKRAGLFWFTVSPLLTEAVVQDASGRSVPRYLKEPELVFERIWALPDFSLHALSDFENSSEPPTPAQEC